jgi:hypothetical protein
MKTVKLMAMMAVVAILLSPAFPLVVLAGEGSSPP